MGERWICAVVICGRPEGEPHHPDCPYADPAPTTDADGRDERRDGAGGGPHNHRERVPGCFRCDLSAAETGEPS